MNINDSGVDGDSESLLNDVIAQGDLPDNTLDDTNAGTNTNEGGEGGQADNQQSPSKQGDSGSGAGNAGQQGSTPADGKQQTPGGNTQQTPQPQTPPQGGRPQALQDGSLRLPNGEIIAGGVQRRLYERGQTLLRHNEDLTRENEQLKQATEAFKQAQAVATQYSMKPEDLGIGLNLLASFRRDPGGTIRGLMTQAQRHGKDLSALNDLMQGGGIDPSAIAGMIEDKLRPITQQYEQRQQQQQRVQESTRVVDNFLSQYQDANTHIPEIQAYVERNPKATLTEAYFAVKSYFAEKGLDWSKSLKDNAMEAAQRNASQQSGTQNGQQRANPPSMPSGRAAQNNAAPVKSTYADPNASYADIVRSVASEIGYKV